MARVNREFIVRVAAVTGTVVSLVALAVAAAKQPEIRRVRARHEVLSPSGRFVAKVAVEQGPDGQRGWRPIVTDTDGVVVFRSELVLPERPNPKIIWEADLDTLWVVVPGGVVSFVQEGLRGWTWTTLAEGDTHLAPEEARA